MKLAIVILRKRVENDPGPRAARRPSGIVPGRSTRRIPLLPLKCYRKLAEDPSSGSSLPNQSIETSSVPLVGTRAKRNLINGLEPPRALRSLERMSRCRSYVAAAFLDPRYLPGETSVS